VRGFLTTFQIIHTGLHHITHCRNSQSHETLLEMFRMISRFLQASYRIFSPIARQLPSGSGPPYSRVFTITLNHPTLDSTTLDKRSARRRDFYLTTHNIYKRQTSMPPAGFEPAISANERPQTHTFARLLGPASYKIF